MRPKGIPALMASPNDSRVAAIILLSKGPQARVLELPHTLDSAKQSRPEIYTHVMFRLPKWFASVRLR
jgi:hypothetical protein